MQPGIWAAQALAGLRLLRASSWLLLLLLLAAPRSAAAMAVSSVTAAPNATSTQKVIPIWWRAPPPIAPTVIPVVRRESRMVHGPVSSQGGETSNQIAEGGRLSHKMQVMADSLPDGATRDLLKSFKICAGCKKFERLGEAHDGGYLTCMDGLYQGRVKAAYSMGIERQDKWSVDVYNLLKVPVNQFDCTVSHPAGRCDGCHFYPACLMSPDGDGAVAGKKGWTLEKVLQETGQKYARPRTLLMKMDIEGAEWPILAAGETPVLKKFDQLIFEFHKLSNETMHDQYAQAMSKLHDAGFRVAHIHGNNDQGMYVAGAYVIPNVIEVTLLSQGDKLPSCHSQTEYSPLDATNFPDQPELPNAKLPS